MNVPYVKQLIPGNQLFVGLTYDRRGVVSQHIALWQRITPVPADHYLILKMQHEFSDACDVLFFTNKTALEQFEQWWTKYSARFPKDQVYMNTMPQPQEGVQMSGYPLMHANRNHLNMMTSQIQRLYHDQWHWIAENTSDPVIWTKDFWLFENEAEMVMFKLRDKRVGDEDENGEGFNIWDN
jgi:hypothetical protein